MKRMNLQLCLLSVLLCLFGNIIYAQETTNSQSEKREAEKAWEALIKTKGGREKLHCTKNMLREMRLGNNGFSSVWLLVFPYYAWHFAFDFTGEPSVDTWNGKKSINQFVTGNHPISTEKRLDESESNAYSLERIIYLLETKWDKPELLRVKRIKQGKKMFDVIEASVKNQRIDFIYEQEEMLVQEIDIYYKGIVQTKYSFLDYIDVDGIKMPQKQGLKTSKYEANEKFRYDPVRFSFNVEYDPQIFESPKATTPDAWKPKPKN